LICLGDLTEYFQLLCSHKYCKDCLSDYLKNKFNYSEVEFIKCPSDLNCDYISDSLIKELVSNEEYEKYQKFLEREKIKKNTKLIFCPFTDCESFAEFPPEIIEEIKRDINIGKNTEKNYEDILIDNEPNSSNEKELTNGQKLALAVKKIDLTCKKGHTFCNLCREKEHGNNKCGNFIDNEFGGVVNKSKNKNIRQCPLCNFFIEKNEGCNHMTCPNQECKYEFCWICMGEYTVDHFNRIGTRCYQGLFINQNSNFVRYPWMNYGKNFLIYILSILIIPIAIMGFSLCLIFGWGILIYSSSNKKCEYEFNNDFAFTIFKIISFFFHISISIPMLPIVILADVILLIAIIIILIGKFAEHFC